MKRLWHSQSARIYKRAFMYRRPDEGTTGEKSANAATSTARGATKPSQGGALASDSGATLTPQPPSRSTATANPRHHTRGRHEGYWRRVVEDVVAPAVAPGLHGLAAMAPAFGVIPNSPAARTALELLPNHANAYDDCWMVLEAPPPEPDSAWQRRSRLSGSGSGAGKQATVLGNLVASRRDLFARVRTARTSSALITHTRAHPHCAPLFLTRWYTMWDVCHVDSGFVPLAKLRKWRTSCTFRTHRCAGSCSRRPSCARAATCTRRSRTGPSRRWKAQGAAPRLPTTLTTSSVPTDSHG